MELYSLNSVVQLPPVNLQVNCSSLTLSCQFHFALHKLMFFLCFSSFPILLITQKRDDPICVGCPSGEPQADHR